jgi:beta-glucosidase
VGSRLPSFTKEQAQRLQGSLDFIGVDHYFTMYCFDVLRKSAPMSRDYAQDMSVGIAVERDGIPISVKTSLFGMPVVPQSIQAVLEYVEDRSHNMTILVYEDGFAKPNNSSIPLSEALNDQYRIDLHGDVLQYVLAAIRNGSDIRGYFWEQLSENTLKKTYISDEDFLARMEVQPYEHQIGISHFYHLFYKGDLYILRLGPMLQKQQRFTQK